MRILGLGTLTGGGKVSTLNEKNDTIGFAGGGTETNVKSSNQTCK